VCIKLNLRVFLVGDLYQIANIKTLPNFSTTRYMVRNFEVSSNKPRGSPGRVRVSSIAFSAMSQSILHIWMDFVIIAMAHLSDNFTHFETVWGS
jgi:hypothetical protein